MKIYNNIHLLIVVLLLILVFLFSCTTNFQQTTKLTDAKYPEKMMVQKNVLITGFENQGGDCFRQKIIEYLSNSKVFHIVNSSLISNNDSSLNNENVDYIISGEVEKFIAGSNVADRNIGITYFTAFIITSPIALGIANTTWEGYAIASASMKIFDAKTTANIWEKKHTIMIEEKDKSVISQDQLHEIMLKTACNNLAIELMNLFMRDYSSILQR